MRWDAGFVIGQLFDLRSKLGDPKLSADEIDESIAVEQIVRWVDGYSKLDPKFHPCAQQFGAAAGCIRAMTPQLKRGNRARARVGCRPHRADQALPGGFVGRTVRAVRAGF